MSVKFGVISDIHNRKDRDSISWFFSGMDTHYRQFSTAEARLTAFVNQMNDDGAELIILMGDNVDAHSFAHPGQAECRKGFAKARLAELIAITDNFTGGDVLYMMGNHDAAVWNSGDGADNLVDNWNMKDDSDWAAFNNATGVARSDEQRQVTSVTSFAFTATEIKSGVKSNTFTTVDGQTYAVKFYIKPPSTKAGYIIRKGDNSGDLADVDVVGLTPNVWQQVTATVEESAQGAGAYVVVHSGADTEGEFFVDEVEVYDTAFDTYDESEFWTAVDTGGNIAARANEWNGDGTGTLAYTYDYGGLRFVCAFASTGGNDLESPGGAEERTWLTGTALNTEKPTIVLTHAMFQPTDYSYSTIDDYATIQDDLEGNGKVQFCVQSHFHRNSVSGYTPVYNWISDILYYFCRGSVLGKTDGAADNGAAADSAYYLFEVEPNAYFGDSKQRMAVSATGYLKGKSKTRETFFLM